MLNEPPISMPELESDETDIHFEEPNELSDNEAIAGRPNEPEADVLEDPYDISGQPPLEVAVLASILTTPTSAELGLSGLRSEHFVGSKTKLIANSMERIFAKEDTLPEISSVIHFLKSARFNSGTSHYEFITPAFIDALLMLGREELDFSYHYAKIQDESNLKRIAEKSAEVIAKINSGSYDTSGEPLSELESMALDLGQSSSDEAAIHISEAFDETVSQIAMLAGRTDEITGVATGFHDLDSVTRGFQPGQLVIVAGLPGSGKTGFALNMASNMGIDQGVPVMFFSMEMTGQELMKRLISNRASIPHDHIKSNNLSEAEWDKVASVSHDIRSASFKIKDDNQTLISLKSHIYQTARLFNQERADEEFDPRQRPVFFIDYLGLMNMANGYGQNRVNQIAEITRSLKVMARDLQVVIVCLSQLNREAAKRDNKRPVSADLRDSGAIEQDADLILMTYRDDTFYNHSGDQGIAEIIVTKNRSGENGNMHLAFLKDFASFYNLCTPPPFGNGVNAQLNIEGRDDLPPPQPAAVGYQDEAEGELAAGMFDEF